MLSIEKLIFDIIHTIIFPGLIAVTLLLLLIIWAERKLAALVQLRYGPLYVSRRIGGALQMVADLLRFLTQEVILPRRADAIAFLFAPVLAMIFAIIPVMFIPIAPNMYPPIYVSSNLLVVLALLTLAPIYVILMGWASDNKFAFVGSLREAFLIISYEIPFIISLLSMAIIFGSLDLVEIVSKQALVPGLILNPIAAIVAFIAILRVTSRFPFEISEAESEIVAGPYTEYSGLMFGASMGIPYIKLYVYSLVFTHVFLGGWLPYTGGFEGIVGFIVAGVIVLIKVIAVMMVSVFLRAIYPRLRLDQALVFGWSTILALSIVSVIWSIIVAYINPI